MAGALVGTLQANVGVDIGSAVRNLRTVGDEFDRAGQDAREMANAANGIKRTGLDNELKDVANAAHKAKGELKDVAKATGQAEQQASGFGKSLGAIKFAATAAGFVGIGAAVVGFAKGMISGAAEMERYETQFSVLLGSLDAAKARIKELTQFAASTPFEIPQVVEASKILQTFTGDVLSTGDGLKMIGDVAAGTGQDIAGVATWFGRMYDSLKSGRPIGEAAARLQEMGALSGESRAKIEELAKTIASGSATIETVWPEVASMFGRYSGMMEKQSETLEGAWSNLQDTLGMGMSRLGEKILPGLKAGVQGAITAFEGLFAIMGTSFELIGRYAGPIMLTAVGLIGVKLVKALGAAKVGFNTAAIGAKLFWSAALVGAPIVIGAIMDLGDAISDFGNKMEFGEAGAHQIKLLEEAVGSAKLADMLWDWGVSVEEFQTVLDKAGGDVDYAFSMIEGAAGDVGKALFEMDATSDKVATGMIGNFGRVGPEAAAKLAEGAVTITSAADEGIGKPLRDAMHKARADAYQAALATPGDIAKGLIDGQKEVESGMATLKELMNDEWDDASRIAYLKGVLASEELAAGLVDTNADVRGAAKQVKEDAERELQYLESGAYDAAVDAGVKVQVAFDQARVPVAQAAARVRSASLYALKTDPFYNAGAAAIAAFAAGIRAKGGTAAQAAQWVAQLTRNMLPGSEPKDPRSPLRGITKGFGFGDTLAKGILSQSSDVSAAARTMAGLMMPSPAGVGFGGTLPAGSVGMGGGPIGGSVSIYIEHFHGTEADIDWLMTEIGRRTQMQLRR